MTVSVLQGVSLLRIGKMKFGERSERTFSLIDDQLGGSFIDVRPRALWNRHPSLTGKLIHFN